MNIDIPQWFYTDPNEKKIFTMLTPLPEATSSKKFIN
jgi:hypothetical protein